MIELLIWSYCEPMSRSAGRVPHPHKDDQYVGPYKLEKTLGKGQTGELCCIGLGVY